MTVTLNRLDTKTKITKFVFRTNAPHKVLSDLLQQYAEFQESVFSPYGERVIVKTKQTSFQWKWPFQNLVNVRGRYDAFTESGKFLEHIRVDLWGMKEIYPKVNYLELVRALIQCVYSGASATDEDEHRLRAAVFGPNKEGNR